MSHSQSEFVVIGAGIYGMYAARMLGRKGRQVTVIDAEPEPFGRASYVNQARVHKGYHYPRSIHTAGKSAGYYERFNSEFSFAINNRFRKVYAISRANSLTNAEQFKRFCNHMGIRCEEMNPQRYFRNGLVEAAFDTEEVAFDAEAIKYALVQDLRELPNVSLRFGNRLVRVENDGERFTLHCENGDRLVTGGVLNATYAGTNQVAQMFGIEPFRIKYEICEVVLVNVSAPLDGVGITVMDGPFFSVMPFGHTSWHSLTSVSHTPHLTSYEKLPAFECQKGNPRCTPTLLDNCNRCPSRPASAARYMMQLAHKYLSDEITLHYDHSVWAIKPILMAAESSDARPTIIRRLMDKPFFATVLSGKINTVYDLEVLFA